MSDEKTRGHDEHDSQGNNGGTFPHESGHGPSGGFSDGHDGGHNGPGWGGGEHGGPGGHGGQGGGEHGGHDGGHDGPGWGGGEHGGHDGGHDGHGGGHGGGGDCPPICFLAGTMVATPSGDVPVESLKPGDLVSLTDGRAVPVSWLGVQTISTRFADPLRVLPIRIAAGALGEGLPKRDLLVSCDHALLMEDVLVQAGALVNGLTITREAGVPEVFRYYHVEVADHSLILAEGVGAETFVDNVSRMAFDNWEERGDAEPIMELELPRVKSARQLPRRLRQLVAERVRELNGEALQQVA